MSIEFDIKESTKVKGVYILKPSISEDIRGNIWTSFLKDKVEKLLPKSRFVPESYVLVGRDLGCDAVRVYHVRYELFGRDFGVRRRVRRY